jgi:DNA-binding transcriptional LysR family regulator
MNFKLRQMEVFRAIMIAGSVSGAARMLFVSQPAVSRLLAHMEASLGLKLFHRTGGKLAPTFHATLLLDEVNRVYDSAQRVNSFVSELSKKTSDNLKIACSPSLGLQLIPKLMSEFLDKYPDVHINFHTTLIQDAPIELLSGKIDLAVLVLPIENQNLYSEALIKGRMVCAVPSNHPLASYHTISLSDLQDYPLVLYSRSIPFGQLLVDAADRYGYVLRAAVNVPRAELACSLVNEGVGVAIIDQFSVARHNWSNLVVRPLTQEIPITVSLVTSKFTPLSSASEKFIRLLRNKLKAESE